MVGIALAALCLRTVALTMNHRHAVADHILQPLAVEEQQDGGDHTIRLAKAPPPAPPPAEEVSPLVSIITTTHDSQAYLADAVASLQAQTLTDWELIVVDDSSTDGTFALLAALAVDDPRIRPVHLMQSAGTYVGRNLALTLARGEYVALHDSDDVSTPDRLAKQVGALSEHPTAVACTCNYERRDNEGRVVMNRGRRARLAFMALMFRRAAVMDRIGFFDSVRTSADEEFRDRLLLAFGQRASVHVDETLYHARSRSGSLTTTGGNSLKLDVPDLAPASAFLSPVRLQYLESFRAWHVRLAAGQDGDPYMPFPLTRRRFPAPASLLPSPAAAVQSDVHAAVASVPGRVDQLQAVVSAIAPQVDVLHVYLNGYTTVPAFLRNNPSIRIARSQDWGDRRDNGKFFFLGEAGGYYITLDDDLAYPPDYVRTLLLAIEKYGRRAVVGVHGVLLADPMTRFYANRTVFGFKRGLSADRSVHLLGTGTIGFHRDTLGLSHSDFGQPGMADLWFAIAAKQQGVPLRCIARQDAWVTPLLDKSQPSLFKEFTTVTDSDAKQTAVAVLHGPWDEEALRASGRALAQDLLDRYSPVALASRGVNASELAELVAVGVLESGDGDVEPSQALGAGGGGGSVDE